MLVVIIRIHCKSPERTAEVFRLTAQYSIKIIFSASTYLLVLQRPKLKVTVLGNFTHNKHTVNSINHLGIDFNPRKKSVNIYPLLQCFNAPQTDEQQISAWIQSDCISHILSLIPVEIEFLVT